jgi:RNA polymerase sigma factor (TIGR02999 family)
MSSAERLTELIQKAAGGDSDAADALFSAIYPELRRLARSRLRGGRRGTLLETSSLVSEVFLRFATAGRLTLHDRTHFLRWACRAMRSIVIDFSRRQRAQRRGGDARRVAFTTRLSADVAAPEDQILRVHDALEQIAAVDPRLASVVEMRYFGGMTESEIAEALGVTDRTVRRDWEKARLLMRAALA